ncbi:MAG: hypothetical protein QOJ80_3468 [Mycobacterium sp.]|nr:hypothetical protein [Mycobacterium sp.]
MARTRTNRRQTPRSNRSQTRLAVLRLCRYDLTAYEKKSAHPGLAASERTATYLSRAYRRKSPPYHRPSDTSHARTRCRPRLSRTAATTGDAAPNESTSPSFQGRASTAAYRDGEGTKTMQDPRAAAARQAPPSKTVESEARGQATSTVRGGAAPSFRDTPQPCRDTRRDPPSADQLTFRPPVPAARGAARPPHRKSVAARTRGSTTIILGSCAITNHRAYFFGSTRR